MADRKINSVLDETVNDKPVVASSLSAFMKLAESKGFLEKEKEREPSIFVPKAKKAKLEVKVIKEDPKRFDDGPGGRRRDRNQLYEVKSKEEEEFKPEIKFEYTDDLGNKLSNPKEAFRHLSHKFHGKGPSKNKIDKRLKKKEIESNMKQIASGEAQFATAAAVMAKTKELQIPYIEIVKK